VYAAVQKLAAESGEATRSAASVLGDAGQAISVSKDKATLKVGSASSAVTAMTGSTAHDLLARVFSQATELSGAERSLSQARSGLKRNLTAGVAAGAQAWNGAVAETETNMSAVAVGIREKALRTSTQLTFNAESISSASSDLYQAFQASRLTAGHLGESQAASAEKHRLLLASMFESLADADTSSADNLEDFSKKVVSAASDKLTAAAGRSADRRSKIEHAVQLTLEDEETQQELLGRQSASLEDSMSSGLNNSRSDLADMSNKLQLHVIRANESAALGRFQPGIAEAKAEADTSLAQVSAKISAEHNLAQDSLRKDMLGKIADVSREASVVGSRLLSDLAAAMGDVSDAGLKVGKAVNASGLALQSYETELRSEGVDALAGLTAEVAEYPFGLTENKLRQNLTLLNTTFSENLSNSSQNFSLELQVLPVEAKALAVEVVSEVFAPTVHLRLLNHSGNTTKIGREVSRALAGAAGIVDTQNARFKSIIRDSISSSVASTSLLVSA